MIYLDKDMKNNKKTLRGQFWYLKNMLKYAFIVVFIVFCGFLYSCKENASVINYYDASENATQELAFNATDNNKTECYVYVCGCVNNPGVYKVFSDTRIYTAIELAGGFTEEACSSGINMAGFIKDGQTIYVSSVAEEESKKALESKDIKININTATKEQLMKLAGVGESKAEDIIAYRKKNGAFNSIEDIMKISGIKNAAFEKIKDNICVE